MAKNILITGGAGFIGSNLIRRLEKLPFNITVVDNLSKGNINNISKNVTFKKGDIRDKNFLISIMNDIDIVVHLAAFGSVIESVQDPDLNFDINVKGTFNILKVSRQFSVEKLIFASTGGALIGDQNPPVNELSLPKPISPYGSSKLCGEAYCHSFSKISDMEIICLRFANVYGPFSNHKSGAITNFIKCLINNQPIKIYGDGNSTRDYLYIDDLCEGIILTLTKSLKSGSILHLASGNELAISKVVEYLKLIANKPNHPVNFLKERKGEVNRNFADYTLAKEILGFVPKFNFEEGISLTWNWFKKINN